jgi:23S rRNA (guanosine2251-2'-O)-methyltransferase
MIRKLKNIELNRPTLGEYKEQKKFTVSVLLDNVRSMLNVGSVFRTCDALNVEKLFLGGITATPPHREITKTAIGAENSVEWEHVADPVNLVQTLKQEGWRIMALEQTDSSVDILTGGVDFSGKVLIVMGNEVHGVSDDILAECDVVLEIPQFGTKHSLNVSVSTGIALWEIMRDKIRTNQ